MPLPGRRAFLVIAAITTVAMLIAKRRATYNGKIQIGTKEELKNHLGRSPDRADAVVLAFSGWTPRRSRSTEAVHWG
ncbi:MAG: hypothetical protein V3S19_06485 [Gemmatimonadales bacterium]